MEKYNNFEKPEKETYINYLYDISKKVKDSLENLDKKTLKEVRATYDKLKDQLTKEKQKLPK